MTTAAPVSVGRNGAAWGLGLHAAQPQGPQKQEGDGRAPAGVFTLGAISFSIAALVVIALGVETKGRSLEEVSA